MIRVMHESGLFYFCQGQPCGLTYSFVGYVHRFQLSCNVKCLGTFTFGTSFGKTLLVAFGKTLLTSFDKSLLVAFCKPLLATCLKALLEPISQGRV